MPPSDTWEEIPVKASGDEWEEIPLAAPPQAYPDQDPERKALSLLNRGGRAATAGMGALSRQADRFVGAPIRAAVGAVQRGDKDLSPAQYALEAVKNPDTAPDWKDIGRPIGLSDEKTIKSPVTLNPWDPEKNKFSPLDLYGSIMGASTDPLNVVPFEKVPAMALKAGIEGTAAVGRKAAPIAAKVLADVPMGKTAEYIKNNKRIRKLEGMPLDDLHGMVDKDVAGINADSVEARVKADDAKGRLDTAYAGRKKELDGSASSLGEARDIMAAIEQEKSHLGSLSEQADDALLRSGATFKRGHLLAAIDKAGGTIGQDVVGEQAKAAVAKLQGIRDVVEGLPDDIDAARLRNIMRQIRQDADYDLKAGQFNSASNKVLKETSRSISGALKKASPEYAAYMERMANLADHVEDMSRHFGDETRAMGSMEAIQRGKGPRGAVSEDVLRRYAEATGNRDLIVKLDQLKKNRDTLGRMKSGDISAELFPANAKESSELSANAQMAADRAEGVSRLTPQSSQSIVNRQMSAKRPATIDRDQLQNLSNATGTDYNQMIQDRGVLEAFNKDGTRGGRLAVAGGVTGAAIGSKFGAPVAGAALGTNAGLLADKFAGRAAKSSIDAGISARRTADAVYRTLTSAPQLLGPFQKLLQQAAKNGPKAFLLNHHLLMNNDPRYRATVEGLGGQQ